MTSHEEKQLLLRVVTELAVSLIRKGGFVPFGATLGPGRNVKLLMPKNWKRNSSRDEVEAYRSAELRKAVTETKCKIVCSCADVRIPSDGALVPVLLIHVEQVESPAEDIAYPYLKNGDTEAELRTPTRVETESRIFPGNKS